MQQLKHHLSTIKAMLTAQEDLNKTFGYFVNNLLETDRFDKELKPMNPFKDKLDTLKTKLVKDDDFAEIYDYYFTQLSDNPSFMELGKRVKNPQIKSIVKMVGKYLFGDDATVTYLEIFKSRKTMFYHGGCFISGRIATIIYFDDIEMGMMGVGISALTGEVKYIRITKTMLKDDQTMVMPQKGKQTIH